MYMKKQCSQCKKQKNYSDFNKDKRTKSGLYSACKSCHYDSYKSWRKRKGREYGREYGRKYRKKNRDKLSKRHSEWVAKNVKRVREYQTKYHSHWKSQRKKTSPKFRLDSNLSNAIRVALKGKKAGQRWEKLVGYTIDNLVKHLEAKFELWMSWENYGRWHIDHIIPKSHFKYEVPEDPDFKKCWALENLQPLEAIENIRKNNKI